MKNSKPVIHGPFQDDYNYPSLFEMQSKLGVTRLSFPQKSNKSKGPQKVKTRIHK